MFTKVVQNTILNISLNTMTKGHESSSNKLSRKVNALLIIDVQEKIIRAIFKKDSITKNIKNLIDAYQILEENIFVSEQNPLKLGVTIPELSPIAGFRKFEKMDFSLAKLEEFSKELKDKKISNLIVCQKIFHNPSSFVFKDIFNIVF